MLLFVAIGAPAPVAARASTPNVTASRYDVTIDVRPDGSLNVVERITLKVGAKPITWFERKVSDRRTDGLTDVLALMDGREMPPLQDGVGVRLRQRSGIDARWQFEPMANRERTFELRYRAVRVLAREPAGPHLRWKALPLRHAYPIGLARVLLRAPQGTLAVAVSAEGGDIQPATSWQDGLTVTRSALIADEGITLDVRFSTGTITPSEPTWTTTLERQRRLVPAFLAGGVITLVVGVGTLLMIRVRTARQIDLIDVASWPAEEGDAAPAVATSLLSKGKNGRWLSLQAAFFRLVRDGYLVVQKTGEKSRFKAPTFAVSTSMPRADAQRAAAPHEQWILDGVTGEGGRVDLKRLTAKFMRRPKGFHDALRAEMVGQGLLDADRASTAQALNATAVVLVITAAITAAVIGLWFVESLGPALMAIPGGLAIDAFMFALGAEALSRLSVSGERAAARWRARVTECRQVIRAGGESVSLRDFERWFPLAIGAGDGARWLKTFDAPLRASGADIAWLKTIGSPEDAGASIAMMVAISGASHAGGGAGGAGGGAGGGSSGAG